MSIKAEISIVDLKTKSDLIQYYDGIASLFHESFGKPLDKELWRWAYLDNPFGDPIVSIAVADNKVVGHYAVVPMDLECSTSLMHGYLSMTTMVATEFRRHKLFQLLAERVYKAIEDANEPAVVFGFPNDNSTPGFKKRLGWSISEDYKVVTLNSDRVESAAALLQKRINKSSLTLNLERDDVRKWRTNKPNQSWLYEDGIGLKSIGDSLDIMHLSKPENIKLAALANSINMVLPVTDDFINDSGCSIAFPYRFGYRTFNTDIEPEFFVQMSMSDVF